MCVLRLLIRWILLPWMALIIKLLTLCSLSLWMTYDYISPRERTESTQVYDTLLHSRAYDRSLQQVNRSCLFINFINVLLVNEHDLRRWEKHISTISCLHSRLSDLLFAKRVSVFLVHWSLETNSLQLGRFEELRWKYRFFQIVLIARRALF